MEWIPVSQPPAQPDARINFKSKKYIVTDGVFVDVCDFNQGHGCGTPWAAWGDYGGIHAKEITAWMPLPKPPAM